MIKFYVMKFLSHSLSNGTFSRFYRHGFILILLGILFGVTCIGIYLRGKICAFHLALLPALSGIAYLLPFCLVCPSVSWRYLITFHVCVLMSIFVLSQILFNEVSKITYSFFAKTKGFE